MLVAIRDSEDKLVKIDPSTLTRTDIGSLGVSFSFGGLAWNSSNNTLYMIGGRGNNNLYTVSLETGAATLVGSHGITDLFGLEYDSSTGTMYASQFSGGTSIYTLNLSTGAATLLGNPGTGLGGLAYDSSRDQLVGINDGGGDLYKVDRTNGSLTLLFNGDFTNDSGLAYDASRDGFWDIDYSGNLFFFDATNSYARTTKLTGLGAHDGLALIAIPEPSTWILMGLGGIAMLGRLKRRAAGQRSPR